MDKIVLTGGGTAGHIVPNLALAPYLSDFEIHYIGRPDSMEEKLVKKACPQIIFHPLECVKLKRKFSLKLFCIPFRLASSKQKAKKLLKEIRPKVIFSKGGYVALPVMLAAKNIPMILHESDFSIGLANKLGVKNCRAVCTSFAPLAGKFTNGVCTGAPLRREIYTGDRRRVEAETGLTGRQNLLIMGGSLGAKAVNDAVFEILNELCARFDIVHIAGKIERRKIERPHYKQLSFTDNIADYFAWADLCVTRGGANALFELVALAVPSLIIPLPKGVSRGDQIDNAEYFKSLNCADVLPQEKLTENPRSLLNALQDLAQNRQALRAACRKVPNIDGTEKIAGMIRELMNNCCF